MPSKEAALLERLIIAQIDLSAIVTESVIAETAASLASLPACRVSATELDAVIRSVHARLQISMDLGVAIAETHRPWLANRKPDIDQFYWRRFYEYKLGGGYSPMVLSKLDLVTDDILNLCGDPQSGGTWSRRGLMMGDVQSGKTAAYTALICKAADAGYKLFILLTGTIENLRRQTQQRLDFDFVGLDSSGMLSREQRKRVVGAGLKDQSRMAVVFTSRERDFSSNLVNQLNLRIRDMSQPILLVVKKNYKILANLHQWLRTFNAGASGFIDGTPMMLIDDEADSASVNTSDQLTKPTSINDGIRSLLQLFSQNTYVGSTATPFANIFIDPDTDDEMRGSDLFPKDFIYALDPPSNYAGAEAMFGDDPRPEFISTLATIDDAEDFMPTGHRSTFRPMTLSPSLVEALHAFALSCAIRDLRALETNPHRSMLVNVSRFTAVQESVAELLNTELRQLQTAIQNYSKLPVLEAMKIPVLRQLKNVWDKHFSSADVDWSTIQSVLNTSVVPIVVRSVNQTRGAASLDFSAYAENGLRVVAVGGNSLSRGLTLEGLCISYFYRNTKMYDTLLQMGRWFGYRSGYQDLCRIWLTDQAIHWYRHITNATVELRDEIRRMSRVGLTPKDFGLKVRAHPDTLIITAKNKMRSASELSRIISVSGQHVETAELCLDSKTIESNRQLAARFIASLAEAGHRCATSPWGNPFWQEAPKALIVDFLQAFASHPRDMVFQQNSLANFVAASTEPKLDLWDIAIPMPRQGDGIEISGIPIRMRVREVTTDNVNNSNSVLVSGKNRRVGSPSDEREGFTVDEANRIRDEYEKENGRGDGKGKTIPGKFYQKFRRHPLLVINFISPKPPKLPGTILVAIGLSFPVFDDAPIHQRVIYKINVVEYRKLFGDESDDDLEVEDEPEQ